MARPSRPPLSAASWPLALLASQRTSSSQAVIEAQSEQQPQEGLTEGLMTDASASALVPALRREEEREDAAQPYRLAPVTAVLVLGAVTVLWGAQHVTIKATLSGSDPLEADTLNMLRFGLAALCFSPFLPQGRPGRRSELEWRGGAELGVWLFLGFCLQALGLLYTTAQRSGLLLYLNVKLVPFFAWALFSREVPTSAWLSAAAALLGTCLVAGDSASGVPPNVGDALSLAAAAASAMFILRLEAFAPATEPKALNAVSTLTVAVLSIVLALVQAALSAPAEVLSGPASGVAAFACHELATRAWGIAAEHPVALIYLGVVTTAFTNWLQTIGQQNVPATTASAIYALDPLWGCLFAYLYLGEVLGPQGLLGCVVLFSVWLYQLATAEPLEGARKWAEEAAAAGGEGEPGPVPAVRAALAPAQRGGPAAKE